RLADLGVRHVAEIAGVDRAALEMRRARDDDAAHRAEILRFLEQLRVVHDAARRPFDETHADHDHAAILNRFVGRAECDRDGGEAANVPAQNQIPFRGDDAQLTMAPDLVLERALQMYLDAVLARVVSERRDAHGPRLRWDVRSHAREMVPAPDQNEDDRSGPSHTTRFTIRPRTTTWRRSGRPATCAAT